jgi:hypothetical protein
MLMYSVIPNIAPLIFDPIVSFLNTFEGHATTVDGEKALVYKKFFLQFVNRNCALMYVAFWKKDLELLRNLLLSLLITGDVSNKMIIYICKFNIMDIDYQ